MKKALSALLAVVLLFSLASCGAQKADKYCTHCGNGMAQSDAFCPKCGGAVGGVVPSTSVGTTTTATTAKATTKATTTQAKTTAQKTATTATTAKPTTTTTTTTTTNAPPTTTTTKPPAPTTTAHKHTYVKYVCSGCGEIDKSHAYEYLIEWVKKNGQVDGSNVFYDFLEKETLYSLTYSAQNDYLYFCSTENTDGIAVFAYLALNDYSYYLSYESKSKYTLFGYIDAAEHTATSPITYSEYSGAESVKDDVVELARAALNRLIVHLSYKLYQDSVGVTMADLGLTAFNLPC